MLRERRILVKDLSKTLPGMLRISVATELEAQAFLEAFTPWWTHKFSGLCLDNLL